VRLRSGPEDGCAGGYLFLMETKPMVAREKTRADQDLQRRVVNYLFSRRSPSSRPIEVSVVGDTVTLHGCVRSVHEKWLCTHCCRRVAGVRNLVDQIEVEEEADQQGLSPSGVARNRTGRSRSG
jgi:hypothetical protein